MTEPYNPVARLIHDLTGIVRIEVGDWPGHIATVPKKDGSLNVTIVAPKRTPEEYWFCAGPRREGVLEIRSDLIGSPNLLRRAGEDWILGVWLPPHLIDVIEVVRLD